MPEQKKPTLAETIYRNTELIGKQLAPLVLLAQEARLEGGICRTTGRPSRDDALISP